jgi:hypothetical protein
VTQPSALYLSRLRAMRDSRGAVTDAVDVAALSWAIRLGEREEAAERARRSEDDTPAIGRDAQPAWRRER